MRRELPFGLVEVDISGDAALELRYRPWLPVVEIDGERAFYFTVDEGELRQLIRTKSATSDAELIPAQRFAHGWQNAHRLLQTTTQGARVADRLTVGVAARLSRYLQVLTQAKKMGKERISSQEISDYTNINATQIRRDLSAFGKFGKRGVGYNVDGLLGEIRKILRTQGQHNIALVGAGRLGQAIASSPIFAEHGINIAAVFDRDPDLVGRSIGGVTVLDASQLMTGRPREEHHRRRDRGARARGAEGYGRARSLGREDHLQLLRGAPRRPLRRAGAHLEPCGRAAPRAVLPPRLRPQADRRGTFGTNLAHIQCLALSCDKSVTVDPQQSGAQAAWPEVLPWR